MLPFGKVTELADWLVPALLEETVGMTELPFGRTVDGTEWPACGVR